MRTMIGKHNFVSAFKIYKKLLPIYLNRRLFSAPLLVPPVSCKIQILQKRYFALKLYSQHIARSESLSEKVFEYIKYKNNLDTSHSWDVTNVYDNNNALKQLQSLVIHSLRPSPSDVLKLFTLYTNCSISNMYQNLSSKEIILTLQSRIESTISQMTFEELYQFAIILKKLMPLKIKMIHQLARSTFEESLTRAETCESLEDIFKYFIIGLEMYGNGLSRQVGYKEYISLFEVNIKTATPFQWSQLLHFVGLSKSKGGSLELPQIAIKELIHHFEKITFIDAGLAVSGIFKLGIRVENESLLTSQIAAKIVNEINTKKFASLEPLESFSLVSLIKYLRMCSYKDDEKLLGNLKHFLNQIDEVSLNPQLVCHLLALFANSNYYDFEVYTLLEKMFTKYLECSESTIRIKDISRVMWALSHTQHKCDSKLFKLVIKSIETFCNTGDFLLHCSHVCDCALALATYGFYNEKLISSLLNSDVFEATKGRARMRHLSRFQLLSEVQKVVLPSLCISTPSISAEELPRRSISDEIFHRPAFGQLRKGIKWLETECKISLFQMKFLVPHIHHCSIVLNDISNSKIYTREVSETGVRVLNNLKALGNVKIAVDVNDNNTSLSNVNSPLGLEVLKRNLLQLQGWDVRVVTSKDVEQCGDDVEQIAALIIQTIQKNERGSK